jgi:hypothetical protein
VNAPPPPPVGREDPTSTEEDTASESGKVYDAILNLCVFVFYCFMFFVEVVQCITNTRVLQIPERPRTMWTLLFSSTLVDSLPFAAWSVVVHFSLYERVS